MVNAAMDVVTRKIIEDAEVNEKFLGEIRSNKTKYNQIKTGESNIQPSTSRMSEANIVKLLKNS